MIADEQDKDTAFKENRNSKYILKFVWCIAACSGSYVYDKAHLSAAHFNTT